MQQGNLTLCLSILEGEEPQRRSIEEALAQGNSLTDNIVFIGFSPTFQKSIQKIIPPQHHDNFFRENLENRPEILSRILKSSTKTVVFNHVLGSHRKKDRINLILQLLNAGINVFTSASLACFEFYRQELKDYIRTRSKNPIIPTSFFKYISRVILVNNFNDTSEETIDYPIRELLSTSSEKNYKERLTNMAFVLATHINYHNSHMISDQHSTPCIHNFPKKMTPLAEGKIKLQEKISSLGKLLRKQSFDIISAMINILIGFFCSHLLSPGLSNPSLLIFFLLCAFVFNVINYSFLPILISLLFSIGLKSYYVDFQLLGNEKFLTTSGLFIGLFLFYIVLQNNRILFQQKHEVEKKEMRFNSLYKYTETLATAANLEEIFHISQKYFSSTFKVEIILMLQNPQTLKTYQIITASKNKFVEESADDLMIKQAALEEYAEYEFIPLLADSIELGWIGISNPIDPNLIIDKAPLNSAILQLTIALQRYNLSQSYQSAVLNGEKEQLRSVILSSISHDLKTPLTTIIGSCTALEEIENLSEKNKMVLVHNIHEAADQLNQFISNILESSRLATENILQQTSVVYLDEVINVVLHRSKKIIRLFDISITIANPEEAAIYGDFTLIQQVFYNLIENATKYSPVGGKISISVDNLLDKVYVKIYDEGPGVVESKRNLIFDKFYRFQHTDQQKAGTGFGLAICKQIIEAYKGKIWVSDRDDGLKGAQFNIELPCAFPKPHGKKQKQGF